MLGFAPTYIMFNIIYMYIHIHPDLYNIWKEIYVIKNKCMCYGNRSND